MHQSVLADVEESPAGAAVPVIWQAAPDVLLKLIEMRERKHCCPEALEAMVYSSLLLRQRLKLASRTVQNSNCAGEAEFPGAAPDHDGVFRIANTGAQHGVDGDSELGM